jgi:predicted Zn-dependent protease
MGKSMESKAAVRRHRLPVALLCACTALPGLAAILPADLEPRVGANYQPVGAEEREIWQRLEQVEKAIRSSPQRLIAPELDAYTRGVVERLIGRPAPDLRIYLMRDATPNAAVLPSGMMIVNTGLLARVRNEAQLAAVLGHEAAHYFRRHSLDLFLETRRKSSMASAAATALSSYEIDGNNAWKMINQAIMMSSSRFSRDLESEADAYGLTMMARAGYPPGAAFAIWEQLVDERRAGAAAHHRRYADGTGSDLSTHPPTKKRMADLADTAEYLAAKGAPAGCEAGREGWAAVIRPYRAMLLHQQVYLNDPGASLYLLENLAKDGWTGLLRFTEGEVYRLRNANGDDLKAAAAYVAAIALPDAPPEAWRAHGYALLKAGKVSEAGEALHRYLALEPDAPDAAMIRFTLTEPVSAEEALVAGSNMAVTAGSAWKKLPPRMSQTRWEDVWTWNGPQLDRVTLVRGLPGGKAMVSQETKSDQQVPVFRADMTAQDLMSMLEVSYRVNGVAVFDFESVEPVDFLGGSGVRLRYAYTSGIGIAKRGDCVMRVVDGKLYAMKLESVAGHYFDTVDLEFDQLIASAQLRLGDRPP